MRNRNYGNKYIPARGSDYDYEYSLFWPENVCTLELAIEIDRLCDNERWTWRRKRYGGIILSFVSESTRNRIETGLAIRTLDYMLHGYPDVSLELEKPAVEYLRADYLGILKK